MRAVFKRLLFLALLVKFGSATFVIVTAAILEVSDGRYDLTVVFQVLPEDNLVLQDKHLIFRSVQLVTELSKTDLRLLSIFLTLFLLFRLDLLFYLQVENVRQFSVAAVDVAQFTEVDLAVV